jgi:hypothetical protein
MIRSDVLTKPKQRQGFRKDRAMLMNVPDDYNDEEERKKTHPNLHELLCKLEKVIETNSM